MFADIQDRGRGNKQYLMALPHNFLYASKDLSGQVFYGKCNKA